MAAVAIPIVTTILAPIMAAAVQSLVKTLGRSRVPESVITIQGDLKFLQTSVDDYECRRKDSSSDWRSMIADLRRLVCRIEDTMDKFRIKKLTLDQFKGEIAGLQQSLGGMKDGISNYIKQHEHEGEGQEGSSSDSSSKYAGLVGIEKPLKDVLALVRPSSNNQQVTKVISIFGPGVGKSCLAEELFSHPEVQKSCPLRAIVDARSMPVDVLLREVLRKLLGNVLSGGQLDQEELIEWARQRILSENKRCLVVIDDVPDQQYGSEVIKVLRDVIRIDGIIIMTTTEQNFAESWSGPDGHVYKSGLEDKYDSLPGIVQQTCLMYLSMFRPEHTMRGSLMRRWSAEGGEVWPGNSIAALDNWKMLVDRRFVFPIPVIIHGDQGAKTWWLSRAMLGYISDKSRLEGFARMRSVARCEDPHIRRLSLQADPENILQNRTAVSSLRTLVVSPEKDREIKAADLGCLDECGLLRVLDLEACSGPGNVRVENVCNKLKLLKYLSLGSDLIPMGRIPQAIKELKQLETLDVGKNKVIELHFDVLLLKNLKHLVGKFKLGDGQMGRVKSTNIRAKDMETLAGFVTRHGKAFPQLMKQMKNLRKVKMFFDTKASSGSKFSSRLADAIKEFLLESSAHLTSHVERRTLCIDLQDCNGRTKDVLGSLEKASSYWQKENGRWLYSLKLCGTTSLSEFPQFIRNLNGIQKLCISFDTITWQHILDGGNQLPALKYLKLTIANKKSSSGKHEDPIAGKHEVAEVLRIEKDKFNKLERMCLESTEKKLPKIEIDDDALPELVSLHLISKAIGRPTEVIVIRSGNSGNKTLLKELKEVALQSSSPVGDDIMNDWYKAARDHPNSPQVLFIEGLTEKQTQP